MNDWIKNYIEKHEFKNQISEYVDKDVVFKNNIKQRRIYEFVEKHLNSRSKNKKQLFLEATGKAGTGKSYTIKQLSYMLGSKCIITSFTGLASLSINGMTINSTFSIPLNLNEYVSLNKQKLKQLQMNFDKIE